MSSAVEAGLRELCWAWNEGRTLSRAVQEHRGGPGNPIDPREKFLVATRDALEGDQQRAIIEAVERVESMTDVREMAALL